MTSGKLKDKNKSSRRRRYPVAITLDEKVIERVDFYSKKFNINRSKFIENLIIASLDDMKLFDDIKLIDFYVYLKRFFDNFDSDVLKKLKHKGFLNEEAGS